MVKFIDRIICYSILEKWSNVIDDKALSVLNSKINQEFILKLEQNCTTIVAKTQLYFSSHHSTCFKYKVADLK